MTTEQTQKTLRVGDIVTFVTYKRINHIYLRMSPPDGIVRISAPVGTGDARLAEFVRGRRVWIERRRAACMAPERQYITGETVLLWGDTLSVTLCAGRASARRAQDGLLLTAPANADRASRERILKAFYREELARAIAELWAPCQRESGAAAAEWRIRDMKTRWGSCNIAAKRVWLSLRLAEKPPECLRYVLLHELCHLHERGHGRAFWERMDACCPDWRAIRKRLKQKDALCV